jgi:hypothetical protein
MHPPEEGDVMTTVNCPSASQQPRFHGNMNRRYQRHLRWCVKVLLEHSWPQGREHHDELHPRVEQGRGGRVQASGPASNPAHPGATGARRKPAGRDRLHASAAYPGEAQRPSSRVGGFPGKGFRLEPIARRPEIGCSRKGNIQVCILRVELNRWRGRSEQFSSM